jgi:hypothetical protein
VVPSEFRGGNGIGINGIGGIGILPIGCGGGETNQARRVATLDDAILCLGAHSDCSPR